MPTYKYNGIYVGYLEPGAPPGYLLLKPRQIAELVRKEANAHEGPVMVILDSDHAASHVLQEMELYGPLVTSCSFMLVQDGVSSPKGPSVVPFYRRPIS